MHEARIRPARSSRLALSASGLTLAVLVVAGQGALASVVEEASPGLSRATPSPAAAAVEVAGRKGTEYGKGGKPPPRGSSAEIYGGSSADRYGGPTGDKGGVAGRHDTRVERPKTKAAKGEADKAAPKPRKENDLDQDRVRDDQGTD